MTAHPVALAIANETDVLRDFVSLLEAEQEILIAGDADALPPLTDKKAVLVSLLDEAGKSRDKAFEAVRVSTDRAAIDAYLNEQGEALQSAWTVLLDFAKQANELNTINGTLISTRLQYNQAALATLVSAAAGSPVGAVYGPDGHRNIDTGTRPLASA